MADRDKVAREFAALHGVPVEPWMLWEGWGSAIGCENCSEIGPYADCWGFVGCHGYFRGCCCRDCEERQREELLAALAR
ncbi:hypothetical protein [Desulfovirgula thermocuniculi]|uniref:hypothetical protein n=1 Tax=Desulfovirgula thermocuniculi TaxID=348842 RepID=UPI000425775F|nr:hypothetical protein [Desulfovirgula thermocuniculi]